MAWTRKLSRQGNTFIVTIPRDAVGRMGVRQGDMMMFEQPFSRSIAMTPLDAANLATSSELVRLIGWMSERAVLEKIVSELGADESVAGVGCIGCSLHPARWRIREIHVCQWCMTEIGNAFSFRSRPSQTELDLRSRGLLQRDL